jgi:hypothetical protein
MSWNGSNPRTKDLSRLLLSFETTAEELSTFEVSAAFLVSEKLRSPLSKLVGAAGFRSLLLRALALAKREDEGLDGVQVKENSSLEGLTPEADESGIVLITHLLGLLETFIGEPLTLHLLMNIWPDLSGCDMSSKGGNRYDTAQECQDK